MKAERKNTSATRDDCTQSNMSCNVASLDDNIHARNLLSCKYVLYRHRKSAYTRDFHFYLAAFLFLFLMPHNMVGSREK